MEVYRNLDTLLTKAKALADDNKRLKQRNNDLQAEVKTLKDTLDGELRKGSELQDKIKLIKLAQQLGDGKTESAELTELKRKINEYIREIDNCLAMLNE